MQIDDELAAYLQPGPFSCIVASADPELRPETVRGWGLRMHGDRSAIDIFVGREPSRRLRDNLSKNNAMALAIANVTTYQTVQLKGKCVAIGEPSVADLLRVHAHGEGFVRGVQLVGVSEHAARGSLVADVVKLILDPEALFDQTPGPEAGVQR